MRHEKLEYECCTLSIVGTPLRLKCEQGRKVAEAADGHTGQADVGTTDESRGRTLTVFVVMGYMHQFLKTVIIHEQIQGQVWSTHAYVHFWMLPPSLNIHEECCTIMHYGPNLLIWVQYSHDDVIGYDTTKVQEIAILIYRKSNLAQARSPPV